MYEPNSSARPDPTVRDCAAASAIDKDIVPGSAAVQTVMMAPALLDDAPKTAPPKSVGDYEILGELGRGGMGVVYQARHKALKRIVALKMILGSAHAGAEQLVRFRAEAEAVAQLQHPNIVQVFEVGEQDGCPFFALEYVDGVSLSKKINGTPQLPREAAEIVRKLAVAMQAAHERGIIHRDLKPGNVLLQGSGSSAQEFDGANHSRSAQSAPLTPKITDFGLAKRYEDHADGPTHTGAILGTPSYMAPEQAQGLAKQSGPAADIYSLGAVLYELLTGRPPFCGTTLWETLQQVLTRDALRPRQLQPGVPRDLEIICLKALQKEPHKRYASAVDLAEDLRRFLAGEPIHARAVRWWERALKWIRRRPAQAALIAVSFSAIVAILIVSGLWLDSERRAAHERALQQSKIAGIERQRAEQEAQLRALTDLQKKRAEKNLERAKETLDDVLERMAQEKPPVIGQLGPIRRKILEKGLQFYQQFRDEKSDDPADQLDTGRALRRVAEIQKLLGNQQAAESAYDDAIAVLEKLIANHPDRGDVRRTCAEVLRECGDFLKSVGRADEAQAMHGRSAALQKR